MENSVLIKQNRSKQRHLAHIQNAFIERVYRDNNVVFLAISYVENKEANILNLKQLTLLINRKTKLMDQYGQRLCLADLTIGTMIDVEIMSEFPVPTRVRARQIKASKEYNKEDTILDKVLVTDFDQGYILIGKEMDIKSYIRCNINPSTNILDNRGRRIPLNYIKTGRTVKVIHSQTKIMSIPVQVNACSIQILQ